MASHKMCYRFPFCDIAMALNQWRLIALRHHFFPSRSFSATLSSIVFASSRFSLTFSSSSAARRFARDGYLFSSALKGVIFDATMARLMERRGMGNPPFLAWCVRRIYAAIFSFCAGVMPPIPMFGRSLLKVHSHCVAWFCASFILSMMY